MDAREAVRSLVRDILDEKKKEELNEPNKSFSGPKNFGSGGDTGKPVDTPKPAPARSKTTTSNSSHVTSKWSGSKAKEKK